MLDVVAGIRLLTGRVAWVYVSGVYGGVGEVGWWLFGRDNCVPT